ncbi:apoptosis-stimulating of p53 protein 2-like isoform X2 [Uloborus diversus]|uniref:apoptosis-stimulating of p53 protein 2-like isoform X2 n=1 Tax=Uloborus diversus TaxID=327109 RepID=UPI00240A1F03|nr:apoptosis-stimulating of p53 protein 2-like isoform X2 [Uloborus diversus]
MVLLPEDAEMTLAELRQMAARQQHQIEAQQQLLVAKEQRLKFLKQQEARHHNLAEQQLDTSCIQNLRDKVETQELKLRQLRALRGQVEQQKTNNGNLGAELDSIRALFSEKEKELNLAVSKVEELSRQLDEIRSSNNRKNYIVSSASSELENLKRELMYRTKVAEQQNNYICQQRENISLRHQDIAVLDAKINELTQRLHRKCLLNEQLASQIHNSTLARTSVNSINNNVYHAAQIVTVEPMIRETSDPEHTRDDMAAKLHGSHKGDLGEFCLTKNDPKYQTLPYNTKFTLKGKQCEDSLSSSTEDESWSAHPDYSTSNKSNPPMSIVKPSPNMCNFSPRPFNSAYNSNNRVISETQKKSDVESNLSLENSSNDNSVLAKTEHSSEVNPNDSMNNNVDKPPASAVITSYEKSKTVPVRIVKPVVPPKPALPVKPMVMNRPNTTSRDKNAEGKDLVNEALSVLQKKAPENEKSAVRYTNPRDNSQDKALPKSKIATYFPKSESSPVSECRPNEYSDAVDAPKRKSAFCLPIKPKPLTIRKTPGLEPPKLKVQPVSISSMQRKLSDSQLLTSNLKTSLNVQPFNSSTESRNLDSGKPDIKSTDESAENNSSLPSQSGSVEKLDETEAVIESEENKIPSVKELKSNFESSEQDSSLEKSESSELISEENEADDPQFSSAALRRMKKGNLKSEGSMRNSRRVSFDPLALLLDAALEGELELVKKTAKEVPNPSASNDEGITALHNAICAGHFEVVTFLVEFGCDVNAQDSDGWTPLHCAASCNNLPMVKFLVERGACIFATTLSDHETAAEKCEEDEEGFDGCSEYLYSLQENLGVMNNGAVYAVYDYEGQNADELSFKDGDTLTVLRKGDDEESEWWWSRLLDQEGYVPRNLLGLYPRVTSRKG